MFLSKPLFFSERAIGAFSNGKKWMSYSELLMYEHGKVTFCSANEQLFNAALQFIPSKKCYF